MDPPYDINRKYLTTLKKPLAMASLSPSKKQNKESFLGLIFASKVGGFGAYLKKPHTKLSWHATLIRRSTVLSLPLQ